MSSTLWNQALLLFYPAEMTGILVTEAMVFMLWSFIFQTIPMQMNKGALFFLLSITPQHFTSTNWGDLPPKRNCCLCCSSSLWLNQDSTYILWSNLSVLVNKVIPTLSTSLSHKWTTLGLLNFDSSYQHFSLVPLHKPALSLTLGCCTSKELESSVPCCFTKGSSTSNPGLFGSSSLSI